MLRLPEVHRFSIRMQVILQRKSIRMYMIHTYACDVQTSTGDVQTCAGDVRTGGQLQTPAYQNFG